MSRLATALRRRPHALGLRARSVVAFALIGLALSLVLSAVTYNRSRTYLLRQRESVAITQASLNAGLVASGLRTSRTAAADPLALLARVSKASATEPLLRIGGRWFVISANVSSEDLPNAFRVRALRGVATRQRFLLHSRPYLAIAIPITRTRVDPTVYVETLALGELERTLSTLAAALAAGSIIATLLGAVLGLYASRRVLRPLTTIASTSERIARGDLTARIADVQDRDLTRLVTSFNRMAASLEQRIQREHRFASHVSHELRSPLTSLRGAVDLVHARRDELPERSRLGVDVLDDQVKRFERMVLDLLEIAKLEAGVASSDLVTLKLEPLLRTTLTRLEAPIPQELDPGAAAALVSVDVRRFEQVLRNLIENANAHGKGAKAVRADVGRGFVSIHVDDAGPGVLPSERSHVFEPFIRGANGRHLSGAGLGLALVSEHVRLMHGSVDVSESPEHGARFTVRLPEQIP